MKKLIRSVVSLIPIVGASCSVQNAQKAPANASNSSSLEKGIWTQFKKPSAKQIKSQLSEMQFKVTQKNGTEPPFKNSFWDNNKPGLYVDVVSKEPLFASVHKYDSGTGWPSFNQPVNKNFIVEKKDYKLILPRTEVRSKYGDSHLGHIFTDGPKDSTGLRYCVNSAALAFIPLENLEKEGYSDYLHFFKNQKNSK